MRALPPPALLRRLDQRLRLLTGGAQDLDERQRTLRATIEWSYDLLLDEEKALFARLGVFVGGCRLEAAEALCEPTSGSTSSTASGRSSRRASFASGPIRTASPVSGCSRRSASTRSRCSSGSGGLEDGRAATRGLLRARVAEQLDVESRTGDQASSLARLDDDNANLRAALDWARETRDGELTASARELLWGFWATRGYVAEGESALEDALELSGKRPARALLGLCTLRILSGSTDGVLADAQEALRGLRASSATTSAWRRRGTSSAASGQRPRRDEQAEEAWRQAFSYAERGGYAAEKAESIGWLMISAIFGPLPADEGVVRCKEFQESAGDDPTIRAWCRVERSVLEAMHGDFEHRAGAARGRHALDLGARADRLGGEHRAGGLLRRDARGQSGGCGRERSARATRRSSRWASAAFSRRLPASSRRPCTRAASTTRPSASAERARTRPLRTTSSRRCSGAARRAKIRAQLETPTALKRWLARPCGSSKTTDLLNTQATRCSTFATVLTARRPARRGAGRRPGVSEPVRAEGESSLAGARPTRRGGVGDWLDTEPPGLNSRRFAKKGGSDGGQRERPGGPGPRRAVSRQERASATLPGSVVRDPRRA